MVYTTSNKQRPNAPIALHTASNSPMVIYFVVVDFE